MTQTAVKASSIRFIYLLNMLPIIGLLTFYFTHYLEGTYSFIIPLGLVFVWIVLSLLTGKVKGLLINRISVWWIVYLFLCVTMVIIGFSSTNLNFVISRLPIYLVPAIGYFVVRHYNRKEKSLILLAFVIVYMTNLIYNIFLGIQMPGIFEEQVSTEESIAFSTLMNIATTDFIVVGYLLIGALLMAVLIIKEKIWRIISLLLIVPIFYYMLFQNTRGTAILLLMIEIAGFFLAYNEPKKAKNRRAYYLFSVIFLSFSLLIVFIPLMSWVIEQIQSDRLAERFNDLINYKKSGGDTNQISESGSFNQRMLLAKTSFNTFLSSPISILMGIGDHTQAFGGDLIKSGIGNHSEFIDVLARYGLIGGVVFYNIMKKYYILLKELAVVRVVMKYVNIIFCIIIISGFLNLLFLPNILFFLYLVFPIIIEIVSSKIRLVVNW